MPPNNGREDNVEYVEVENPTFDEGYYFGGGKPESYPAYEVNPTSVEAFQEAVETPRTAAKVIDLPSQAESPAEVEDPYASLTRDEMLEALTDNDIPHKLRKNSSRAKVLDVYQRFFEAPGE